MKALTRYQNAPLLNNFFDDEWIQGMFRTPSYMPAVNIRNEEKNIFVELSVPGWNKEDFKIEVIENELVISANVESNNEEHTDNYARREFSKQSFEKRFQLNTNEVDIDNIDARYNAGILTIDLPKVHKEETKKLVQVN